MATTAGQAQSSTRPPVPAGYLPKKQQYRLLHDQLVNRRQRHLFDWREIGRVLFPGRFYLTESGATRHHRADAPRHRAIIDCTGTLAAQTLASGMMSGLTSRARPWFRLTTPDQDLSEHASVKAWLHETTERMQDALLRSNFYNVMPLYYADLGGFGTATMLMEEDDEEVVRFYAFELGSYCIAIDAYARVKVFTRDFTMTARQLVEKFGYDQCSSGVQSAWKNGKTEASFPVTHIIMPNPEAQPGRMSSAMKPFASAYFEQVGSQTTFLSERGYDEFPILSTRWSTGSGQAYASDWPGIVALGDINQLQFGEKKGMQALEKLVSPPMIAPTSMLSVKASILPGDLNFDDTAAASGFRPVYQVKPDLADLENKQAQIRSRINKVFHVDSFLMLSSMDNTDTKRQMTATEIAARQGEKLVVLGPVVEQMDQDCFNPMVNRLFHIMLRRGMFSPPPVELRGTTLKVEYMSIMHAAQKGDEVPGLDRLASTATKIATESQDPSILDVINWDELIEKYADGLSVNPLVMRPKEEVSALRAQRAQKQAQAEKLAQLQQLGAGAKDLSQADTSGKNALTDTLGGLNKSQNGAAQQPEPAAA